VLAPVSSTKISVSGSRSSWPSNHASRALRTSGRSCSCAWPVFFARVMVTRKEAPERRYCHRDPLSRQHRAQFGKGDVRRRLMQRPDPRRARLGLCRARVAALGLGGGLAMVAMKRRPPHRAGRAHPEAPRRGTTRHAPPETAPTTRSRRYIDKGLPICPASCPGSTTQSDFRPLGNPQRFTSRGNCSKSGEPFHHAREHIPLARSLPPVGEGLGKYGSSRHLLVRQPIHPLIASPLTEIDTNHVYHSNGGIA